ADGPRRDRPFTPVNCAGLPDTVLESERFGYERVAFTGAIGVKHGLFEAAHDGTLFLDEIGDIGSALQVKLLRDIQEQEVRRVGGTSSIKVDVRVIAATNRDLAVLVKEGRFREDLFYRLNVIPLTIPPLRDRREDILPLARHFLAEANSTFHKAVKRLATEAETLLLAYGCPG